LKAPGRPRSGPAGRGEENGGGSVNEKGNTRGPGTKNDEGTGALYSACRPVSGIVIHLT
jgi:hypothetical protein